MPAADAADHATIADEERVADSESSEPDRDGFVRRASDRDSAQGTGASLVNAIGDAGAAGACCSQVLPITLVRTHVENEAENGSMTRTTSQEARNFDSIGQLMLLSRE